MSELEKIDVIIPPMDKLKDGELLLLPECGKYSKFFDEDGRFEGVDWVVREEMREPLLVIFEDEKKWWEFWK